MLGRIPLTQVTLLATSTCEQSAVSPHSRVIHYRGKAGHTPADAYSVFVPAYIQL
jgi:hypothetical protein